MDHWKGPSFRNGKVSDWNSIRCGKQSESEEKRWATIYVRRRVDRLVLPLKFCADGGRFDFLDFSLLSAIKQSLTDVLRKLLTTGRRFTFASVRRVSSRRTATWSVSLSSSICRPMLIVTFEFVSFEGKNEHRVLSRLHFFMSVVGVFQLSTSNE